MDSKFWKPVTRAALIWIVTDPLTVDWVEEKSVEAIQTGFRVGSGW